MKHECANWMYDAPLMRNHLILKFVVTPFFVLVLCLGFAPPVLAQGGKAEPLRVQFPRGKNSATLKGTIRGDQQFEYAVEARAGQWMMIEVTSAPLDSAIFLVTDPDGKDQSYHYYWSGTLEQTGKYVVFVTKPAGFGVARFSLTITIENAPSNRASVPPAALSAAMRKLIRAMRTRNTSLFLSLFSRSRPFFHLNPMNVGSKKYFRNPISYARLTRDLKNKGELYWLLIERADNGDFDAFVDNFPDNKMWTSFRGNKFVPRGEHFTSHTYVRWRREGDRWVIAEISYATA